MKNPVRLAIEIVGGVLILCIGISIGRLESKNSPQIYSTTSVASQSAQTTQKMIDTVVNMNDYAPGRYTLHGSGNGNDTLREIETGGLSVLHVKQTGTGEMAVYNDLSSDLLCAHSDDFFMDVILQPHTKYKLRITSNADWEISVYEVKHVDECMFKGDGPFATHMITSTTNEYHLSLDSDSFFSLTIYKSNGESKVIAYGEGRYSNKITVPKDEEFCFLFSGSCENIALKPVY